MDKQPTPASVEEILKEKMLPLFFDEQEYYDKTRFCRDEIFEAMTEYTNLQLEGKERELQELRGERDALAYNANQYNEQLQESLLLYNNQTATIVKLTSECEYWKALAEAGNKILMRQKELDTIGFEWQEYLQLKNQK